MGLGKPSPRERPPDLARRGASHTARQESVRPQIALSTLEGETLRIIFGALFLLLAIWYLLITDYAIGLFADC